MELQDKIAVITGGASGLGRATADYFVARGVRVAIFDLNEEQGARAMAELGEDKALFATTDVTDEASVARAIAATMDKFGAIHININCAGVPAPCKVLDREGRATALKKFAFVVNVNLLGLFNVMSKCAEKMALNEPEGEERGVIVNISSGAAFEGQIGQCAYSASKSGVLGLNMPAARELGDLAICPGLFLTPMAQSLDTKVLDVLKQIPEAPRRPGHMEEFAHCCNFLVENSYMNGRTIRLDAATVMPAK
jgi:NAD(P)-dependent dehydrogenase (short-subunit alcohol dehydrogenase family)